MSRAAPPALVTAAMSLLYFLLMASTFNALGVVLPRMVPDLGLNWAAAGFGFTLLGLSCGLASLLPAGTTRRFGVRATLAAGTALLVAGFLSLARTRGQLGYDVGTILLGIGFCFCGTVPGVHLVAGAYRQRSSTALGVYFTVGSLGAVAGPLFFTTAGRVFGDWRPSWLLCAAAALLLGGFATAVAGGSREHAAAPVDQAGWAVRGALRTPQYWLVVAAYSGCLLVNTTAHSFAVQHVSERGLSLDHAAALVSGSALAAAAAALLAGLAGERVTGRALTAIALAALGVAGAALVLPQTPATLAVFALGFGVGLGVSYVGTANLLLDWFGRRPNLELYSTMLLVSTAAAAGPVLGGIARDATGSFATVFGFLAAIAAGLLAVVLVVPRPVMAGRAAAA